jgi:hypothetical protein
MRHQSSFGLLDGGLDIQIQRQLENEEREYQERQRFAQLKDEEHQYQERKQLAEEKARAKEAAARKKMHLEEIGSLDSPLMPTGFRPARSLGRWWTKPAARWDALNSNGRPHFDARQRSSVPSIDGPLFKGHPLMNTLTPREQSRTDHETRSRSRRRDGKPTRHHYEGGRTREGMNAQEQQAQAPQAPPQARGPSAANDLRAYLNDKENYDKICATMKGFGQGNTADSQHENEEEDEDEEDEGDLVEYWDEDADEDASEAPAAVPNNNPDDDPGDDPGDDSDSDKLSTPPDSDKQDTASEYDSTDSEWNVDDAADYYIIRPGERTREAKPPRAIGKYYRNAIHIPKAREPRQSEDGYKSESEPEAESTVYGSEDSGSSSGLSSPEYQPDEQLDEMLLDEGLLYKKFCERFHQDFKGGADHSGDLDDAYGGIDPDGHWDTTFQAPTDGSGLDHHVTPDPTAPGPDINSPQSARSLRSLFEDEAPSSSRQNAKSPVKSPLADAPSGDLVEDEVLSSSRRNLKSPVKSPPATAPSRERMENNVRLEDNVTSPERQNVRTPRVDAPPAEVLHDKPPSPRRTRSSPRGKNSSPIGEISSRRGKSSSPIGKTPSMIRKSLSPRSWLGRFLQMVFDLGISWIKTKFPFGLNIDDDMERYRRDMNRNPKENRSRVLLTKFEWIDQVPKSHGRLKSGASQRQSSRSRKSHSGPGDLRKSPGRTSAKQTREQGPDRRPHQRSVLDIKWTEPNGANYEDPFRISSENKNLRASGQRRSRPIIIVRKERENASESDQTYSPNQDSSSSDEDDDEEITVDDEIAVLATQSRPPPSSSHSARKRRQISELDKAYKPTQDVLPSDEDGDEETPIAPERVEPEKTTASKTRKAALKTRKAAPKATPKTASKAASKAAPKTAPKDGASEKKGAPKKITQESRKKGSPKKDTATTKKGPAPKQETTSERKSSRSNRYQGRYTK